MKLSTSILIPISSIIIALGIVLTLTLDKVIPNEMNVVQKSWGKALTHTLAESLALDTINRNTLHAQETIDNITTGHELLDYVYITDFENNVFVHTFSGGFPKDLLTIPDTEEFSFQSSNTKYLQLSHPLIDGMKAKLHLGIKQNATKLMTNNLLNNTLLSLFPFFVISLIFTFIAGKRITKPLEALSSLVKQYRNDGKHASFEVDTKSSEVKVLSQALSNMLREQHIIESELRNSESQTRLLLNSTAEAICGTDIHGNCTFANRSFTSLFGYSNLKEVLGKTILPHLKQNHALQLHNALANTFNTTGVTHVSQESFNKINGDTFHAEFWIHPVIENDKILGAVISFLDITDRINAEKLAADLQHSLTEAQRLTHLGSWTLDLVNDKLLWSDEIFNIFGIDSKKFEVNYEAFLDCIHPEDRDYVNAAYKASLEAETPYDVVHRIIRKDNNEIRYVHELCRHIKDNSNNVIRSIGSTHDISKQILDERALRESQQYNRMLFEQSPIGLALSNLDGELIDINPAFARIIGRSINETQKLSYWEITPKDYSNQEIQQLELLKKTGRYGPYEKEYIHKSGKLVPVRLSGLMIERNGEYYIWSSIEDITETKQAEIALQHAYENLENKVKERTTELARANEQLKELDKLKSLFIASMSHELRTPLNAIIGFTSVLLAGMTGDLNEKQMDQLQRVSSSAKHLLALISDIIDISKVEAGHIDLIVKPLKIANTIDQAVSNLNSHIKDKNLKIILDVDDSLSINTDERRLLQVILNVLSNSIKYTETGSITVKAQQIENKIKITISDTGIGITKNDQKKLFEPFERINSKLSVKAGGTGLGLYLTKKIVEDALKGVISIASESDAGTTVNIILPTDLKQ